MFLNQLLTIHQKLSKLSNYLESNQCIDCNRCNHKKRPPRHDLLHTCGEADPYVRFGNGPLTIFYKKRGKCSGSTKSDPINTIHTSKQSTKEGINRYLEEDFRKPKEQ